MRWLAIDWSRPAKRAIPADKARQGEIVLRTPPRRRAVFIAGFIGAVMPAIIGSRSGLMAERAYAYMDMDPSSRGLWSDGMTLLSDSIEVAVGPDELKGLLGVPRDAAGLVIFAHGSGSGRLSPRNNRVAAALRAEGLATLLLDLLTPAEERDRANVFDIELLASRLSSATDWALAQTKTAHLPIGYFGASTGAGAALMAAGVPRSPVAAVVSRGGRPDLAEDALPRVTAPTLLIVGSLDTVVIELNRMAYDRLAAPKEMVVIEGASHLFEEPGTLDEAQRHAARWFRRHLGGDRNA